MGESCRKVERTNESKPSRIDDVPVYFLLFYFSAILKPGSQFLLGKGFVGFFGSGFDLDVGYTQPVSEICMVPIAAFFPPLTSFFPPSLPVSSHIYFLTCPAAFMCISTSTSFCTQEGILGLSSTFSAKVCLRSS